MPTDNLTRTQVVVGAVILVVLAGLLGYWLGVRYGRSEIGGSTPPPSNGLGGILPPGSMTEGSNSVSAGDQPAGWSVLVPSVSMAASGWVVVHDETAGRVLGAQWLPSGNHTNVSVELLRATEIGKPYSVILHSDDGDKTYDLREDMAILDSAGINEVSIRFMATASTTVQ